MLELLTDTFTLSVSPVDVPLDGLRLSHVASSLTDQLSVPPPEFHMLNGWLEGEGFDPWAVLKLKLGGLWDIIGSAGGIIVRDTGTDLGVLVAPDAEIVMVAL